MKKLISQGIETLVPYPPGKPIEELERELGITGSTLSRWQWLLS
jgi:histidinol-phosphate aminotransferase